MLKRICVSLVFLFLMGWMGFAYADTYIPSRTINLVYDDSGSMIRIGDTWVDTWCQAKYAMEVVAAMLDERDTLNIYYMSDYVSGTTAKPRLSLHGSKDARIVSGNVQQIHTTVTKASDTPFNAVRKAYNDLKQSTTDENWLVVLTDGEFEDGAMTSAEVEKYYDDVVADGKTKVMMLAMGPNAAMIRGDEQRGIYFEHAPSTAAILPRLTKICNRIFQRNALDVSGNEVSFGVPMGQLIVFAQGKDVAIEHAISSDGQKIEPSSNVHAMYSTQSSTTNPAGTIVNDSLNGYVATFDANFNPGKYTLNVTNAESIEVYYKPNVEIKSYLYTLDGQEVTSANDIVNGSYKIEFGFVNAANGEKVTDTSLLGKVDYQANIVNQAADGTTQEMSVVSGDNIQIREGKIDIDVTAKFLDYNTVHTQASYEVFFRNELVFNVESKPDYGLTSDGLTNQSMPMVLSVKMKNGDQLLDLRPEQWDVMEVPEIQTGEGVGKFEIRKSTVPGQFEVYPSLGDIEPMKAATGDIPVVITGGYQHGKSSAAGRIETSVVFRDDITSFERFMDWVLRHIKEIIVGFIVFLILWGYMPWVKKYLPKDLVKRAEITAKKGRKGTSKTAVLSRTKRFIPYVAEEGTYKINLTGPGISIKSINMKAAGRNGILLTNSKVFIKNKNYRIRGNPVPDKQEPYYIYAGTSFSIKTEDNEYSFKI